MARLSLLIRRLGMGLGRPRWAGFFVGLWVILLLVHVGVQSLAAESWMLFGANTASLGVIPLAIAWLQLLLAIVICGLFLWLKHRFAQSEPEGPTQRSTVVSQRRAVGVVCVVCLMVVATQGVQLVWRWQENALPRVGVTNLYSSPDLFYLTAVDRRLRAAASAGDRDQQRLTQWRRGMVEWTEQVIASDMPLAFKRGALYTLAHDIRPRVGPIALSDKVQADLIRSNERDMRRASLAARQPSVLPSEALQPTTPPTSAEEFVTWYLTAEEAHRQAHSQRLQERLEQQATLESQLSQRLEQWFARLEEAEKQQADQQPAEAPLDEEQQMEREQQAADEAQPQGSDAEAAAQPATAPEDAATEPLGDAQPASVEQIRAEIGRLSAEISQLQSAQFALRGEQQRLRLRDEFRQQRRAAGSGLNQQYPTLRLPICIPGGYTGGWLYLVWSCIQLAMFLGLVGIAATACLRLAIDNTKWYGLAATIAAFALLLQLSQLVLF